MDFILYRKIIDDLAGMPEPIKTLRLYMMGEPLLNPWFPDMVAYAKATGRFGQIDTTTNGFLLDTKMINRLADCGLDKIFISVPKNYTKEYVSNIGYLHISSSMLVFVKIIGDGMLSAEKKRFMDDFSDIADRVFIENRINCWPNFRSGDDPDIGIYGNPLTSVKTCPYSFYSLAINADGTASTCFLDWPQQMILGDLKKESFKDIWFGKKLRDFQVMQLKGYRHKHPFCSNCHQLTHGCPDDIDPYAEILLDKLTHR
jgi:radical SAM protein with 4Fe4S-binding SPASM domain